MGYSITPIKTNKERFKKKIKEENRLGEGRKEKILRKEGERSIVHGRVEECGERGQRRRDVYLLGFAITV